MGYWHRDYYIGGAKWYHGVLVVIGIIILIILLLKTFG